MDVREKLVELPIEDALLILREEHRQRTDSYTTYLEHGGKGDPDEVIDSIRDYMVQELLGGFDCRKAVSCEYEWTFTDGSVVELRIAIKQPAKGGENNA